MESKETLFEKSLKLRPAERLQLIEMIAKNLDQPEKRIDKIWASEAEDRYNALEQGRVKTINLSNIIAKYK